MDIILFFAIVVATAILFIIAMQSSFGVKFVLLSLSSFWLLGYVLRPLLFFYSRAKEIQNPIYDLRLVNTDVEIRDIFFLIVSGCFIFCILLLFQRRIIWSNSIQGSALFNFQKDSWILSYGITIGLFAQVIEFTPFRNPFSKSLALMIVPIFCSYLWKRDELDFSNSKTFYFRL